MQFHQGPLPLLSRQSLLLLRRLLVQTSSSDGGCQRCSQLWQDMQDTC
jgi:hypothetical protein